MGLDVRFLWAFGRLESEQRARVPVHRTEGLCALVLWVVVRGEDAPRLIAIPVGDFRRVNLDH